MPEEVRRHHLLKEEDAQQRQTQDFGTEGFKEEGWQEVGLACDGFDTFSGLPCSFSSLKCTPCLVRIFLQSFLPFELVSDLRFRTYVQICSYLFEAHVLPSCRKINIFDYT